MPFSPTTAPSPTEAKVPSIPSVKSDNLVDVAKAVKTILDLREGKEGDGYDQYVTWRDLYEAGLTNFSINGQIISTPTTTPGGGNRPNGPVGPGTTPGGRIPPPAPTGFTVTSGYGANYLAWGNPYSAYNGHANTEIWRSPTNNLSTATRIGQIEGNLFADNCGTDKTFYYWIRYVSIYDDAGPFNSTSGTLGQTAADVPYLISQLRDSVLSSLTGANTLLLGDPNKFENVYVVANRFAIVTSTLDSPPGKVPFIVDGGVVYIDIAMIKDATITSAKIQNLAADKITAGTINVALTLNAATINGGTIRSTSGNFEVLPSGQVTIRSDLFRIYNSFVSGSQTILTADATGVYIDNATIRNLTSTNITANSINGDRITTGTLDASKITALSITGAQIAAGTISANKLSVSSLSAITANLGTVTAGVLTASKLVSGTNVIGDTAYPNDTMSVVSVQEAFGSQLGSTAVWATGCIFTTPGGGSYDTRCRGGANIRIMVSASAVVDHFFTVWYRFNGGSWIAWRTAVEPLSGYGQATVSGVVTTSLSLGGNNIEFGLSCTDSAGNPFNGSFINMTNIFFTAMAINL